MRLIACWFAAALFAGSSELVSYPFDGLRLIRRTLAEPRAVTLFVAEVDLTHRDVSFLLTPPAPATPNRRETMRQTTLDFLRQSQAQLAVNAHFFVPFPANDPDSDLIGLAASAGKVYSQFEDPQQSYAIVARAPALNLDAANRARIVHEGDAATVWNALSGSAQVVTGGRVTVPRYVPGQLTPGGPAARYDNERSWYETPNARTLIGLDREARRLVLLVVDSGTAQSRGLTVTEAAELLVSDYGVYDALNLDGGGSTTLAMADPETGEAKLVNRPSGGGVPRAVGSSLAVFAKPRPPRQ